MVLLPCPIKKSWKYTIEEKTKLKNANSAVHTTLKPCFSSNSFTAL
jgi:hypothetical protein